MHARQPRVSIANTVRNATKNWQVILRTTQRNLRRCVPFAHRRTHRFVKRGRGVKENRPLFLAIPATFYRRIHSLPNQSCYTSVTGFPILADSYAAMMILISRRPSSPGVRVCLSCSKH